MNALNGTYWKDLYLAYKRRQWQDTMRAIENRHTNSPPAEFPVRALELSVGGVTSKGECGRHFNRRGETVPPGVDSSMSASFHLTA